MFRFIPSKRSGSYNLEIEGYRYRKNKTTKKKVFYVYVESNCRGTTALDSNFLEIVNCPTIHNHPAVDDYIKKIEIRQKIVSAVENEPSRNMSEIFQDVIQQIPENDENCAPNYRDVRHILYYHRKKQLPCIPKTVSDINFSSSWAKTLSGKQFLLAKNDEVGAVVMSTRFFIENLSDCDTILADGTFKTAPEPFAQIYTIFGVFENQKIPLVFAFLSNKKKESYIFLLRLLEAKAEKLGKRFSPEIFLTDFESGFCVAIKNCFPMAQHLGCHFHYCQAIFKKSKNFILLPNIVKTKKFEKLFSGFLRCRIYQWG